MNLIRSAVFGIGCGLAGIGGVLAAPLVTASVGMAATMIIDAFVIVIIGGMGNLKGVILGGMCIMFFDRVILAQSTELVRSLGRLVGSGLLMRADLSLWRWFFFGLTLIIVMVLRPEGLWPSAQRAAELHASEETA